MAERKDEVEIMAIVITNGALYMYLTENGKHRKTDNITYALCFDDLTSAITYMKKTPAKTKGYYVLDTETRKILWSRSENKIGTGRYNRKKYSQTVKKMLYLKADGRCQLCGRKLLFSEITLDHIVPLACGGADSVENLQICCYEDNQFKRNNLPEDFFERITKIFMYQMEKKNGKTLKWKAFQWILKEMVG